MSNHYYLDISLEFESNTINSNKLTPAYFKNHIIEAVTSLFGTVAACVDIDILKLDLKSFHATLRVPRDHYVKIRSSLTLQGNYYGVPCAYHIHKATPLLLSLQGDSRNYKH